MEISDKDLPKFRKKIYKILSCLVVVGILMSAVPESVVAQGTSESNEQTILVPGSASGSADLGKPWKGGIKIPSGLNQLKIEIDSGDVCSKVLTPVITDPSGNKYGFLYNSIPYSGPSQPQYFIFEKTQPGEWKIEIFSSRNVDFTVTTKTEKSIKIAKRKVFMTGGWPSFVEISLPDDEIFDPDSVKRVKVSVGCTGPNCIKGHGAVTISVPKDNAHILTNDIDSYFWNAFVCLEANHEGVHSILAFEKAVELIAGIFTPAWLGLAQTAAEGILDIIGWLQTEDYSYGSGPTGPEWTDTDKYEIYSFEYTTGSIYSGYACNRIEATFPVELQGTQNIPIHVHSAYTWWDGSVTTKFVGHEETITFKPTPLEEPAKGYPHLEAEYTVNPGSISSIDEAVVVTLKIKGIGGKVEDLPPDILEKLPRKPLDVVLVIDKSGSMDSTDYPPDRITAAKGAAKIFVNQLKEDDRVAAVSFSSSTSTVVSFTADKNSAKSKIGGISTGGGTAVGEGIISALDVLEKGREESVKTIVLLSDGANNQGTNPATAANRAKGRGIPIYTVGIGTVGGGIDPLDEQTLKEIASITGGDYLYAPDEAELKRVYEILSTKVLNVAGTKVSVSVEPTQFFNILKTEPSPLRFENIPPNTEKTVEITGKLTITAPNERIPIIHKYTISYLDIIGKYKTIIGGPIYVEYNVETVPSDVEIRNIEFKKEDGSYKDATVYHLSKDIIAEVEIGNPDDVTVKSTASIYEGNTGKGSTDSKETDKDSITHILNNGGVIGRHIFSDSLYYPGDIQADNKGDIVYTVFDDEDDVDDKWYDGEKMFSNRWLHLGKVSLHPKSNDILRFATISSSGAALKDKAAKRILHYVYDHIEYNISKGNCNWGNDFTILDLNGKNSKGGKTGKPVGLCVDYAAAYISCLRSISIPARGIKLTYDYYPNGYPVGPKEDSGHAFSEVYDGTWKHYDPTWNAYEKPDVYLLSPRRFANISGSVEKEPGNVKENKLTTLKYAVGMTHPDLDKPIKVDLDKKTAVKQKLNFTNRAKSTKWWIFDSEKYIAKDFDIEVVHSGKLETEINGLSRDDILDINEDDHANLKIKVPEDYAKTIDKGSSVTVPIKLKVDYETIDGEEVEKDYTIKVRLER